MTKDTIPFTIVEWDLKGEGVEVALGGREPQLLNVSQVRELRDDMEEAAMEVRGHAKVEVMVQDLLPGDVIYVMGLQATITDLLTQRSKYRGPEWVIQFRLGTWSDHVTEAMLPGDQLVTAYRNPDAVRLL